ncbi:MAG: CARDB domain-containing protein, partial [Candidatus Omnitrophica bacterium]|nr:CARDB domain-containing protein [Candidatus Omnitrophota bacterium]
RVAGTADTQTKQQPVNLSLESIDILSRVLEIYVADNVEFTVTIRNNSNQEVREITLKVESEDGLRENKRNISLRPNAVERIKFIWVPKKSGMQKLTASLDYREDSDSRNNQRSQRFEVKDKKEPLKIKIGEISIEGERRGSLESGRPLNVVLLVESSADFDGAVEVTFSIQSKSYRDRINQKIRGFKKGSNKLDFKILKELKSDTYQLTVEIVSRDAGIKEKSGRDFEVIER